MPEKEDEDCLGESSEADNVCNQIRDILGDDSDADPTYQPESQDSESEYENENVDKKRSRWNKPNPSNWKANKIKALRKSGQAYVSKSGRLQSAKIPKPVDCTKCIYKCSSNFNDEFRSSVCSRYHNLSYERQKDMLLHLVNVCPVERKRKRKEMGHDKKISKKYFFEMDKEKIRVCKNFFLNTLSISHGLVDFAIHNSSSNCLFSQNDKRGRKTPPNKTTPDVVIKIKNHIEKFPVQESHYCRQTSKRKYLDETLSISKMYELFKTECIANNDDIIPSQFVYRNVFCNEYNLSFFKPKKDQCSICTNYKKAVDVKKLALEEEYKEHQKLKIDSYNCKSEDKERCSNDPKFMSATFYLQSVLQIPCSEVSQLYYSRKLSAYNLTVYEAAKPNKAYCFAWTEVNGQRGSCEIGTSLLNWFMTLPSIIEEVSLFSDTCSGQNRNQFMAALFMYIVQKFHFKIIEHKFMEKGHSHMECDSMHSAIESSKKHVQIYIMQDWLNVFQLARSKRNRNKQKDYYVTKELRFSDFKDLKHLAKQMINNTTLDTMNCKVKWLKIKRLRFEKEKPGAILFSYDYTSEYKTLNVNKQGRPFNVPSELENLYSRKLTIPEAKKKDLLNLCKSNIIPEEYHHFYQQLKTSKDKKCRNPEPAVNSSESECESE